MVSEPLMPPDQEKLNEALKFMSSFSSVILGTVSQDGQPHTSYAPHLCHNNRFHVFVSGLARHSDTLGNGSVSLLFIEDEKTAKTLFARTRLTIDCHASKIDRRAMQCETLLDLFEAKHGSTLQVLRTLPDFVLYELIPQRAQFVTGFGAAYDVSTVLSKINAQL